MSETLAIKDNNGMSLGDYYDHEYPSFTNKEVGQVIALELLKIRLAIERWLEWKGIKDE